jgi:hypothetical protein
MKLTKKGGKTACGGYLALDFTKKTTPKNFEIFKEKSFLPP